MHLSTIDMSRDEARERLAEWGEEVKKAKTRPEDEAIAAGYEALSRGKRLIALSTTLAEGGQDDRFLPLLAVAPTRAERIYVARSRAGDLTFATHERPKLDRWSSSVTVVGVHVPRVLSPITYSELSENNLEPTYWGGLQWKAMVPVVPPRFRRRGWKSMFVLFEAEWARHHPTPPVDPALISHLRGDLWVVHALWDLTPLERAVLMERNR